MSEYIKKPVKIFLVGFGSLAGLWAAAALLSGLHHTGWQINEFMRQLFVASGLVGPLHTMVDFYTHIKGIEYIICVLFFVVFPLYFRYVEKSSIKRTTPVKTLKRE